MTIQDILLIIYTLFLAVCIWRMYMLEIRVRMNENSLSHYATYFRDVRKQMDEDHATLEGYNGIASDVEKIHEYLGME